MAPAPLDPVPGTPARKKSDLGVRTLSAIVMIAVAGTVLWLGGWVFIAFVGAVGLGVLWEWWGLARRIARGSLGAAVWMAAGVSYAGVAMAALVHLRAASLPAAVLPIAVVIGVDVGAYFLGRLIGGPKIAPAISPNKTWAGFAGGCLGAGIVIAGWVKAAFPMLENSFGPSEFSTGDWGQLVIAIVGAGVAAAAVAQAGDFFESWMKRRAGMKDSGRLIPGHGGLFDRVDGLLALLFAGAVVTAAF